jgi:hypothetical protein
MSPTPPPGFVFHAFLVNGDVGSVPGTFWIVRTFRKNTNSSL